MSTLNYVYNKIALMDWFRNSICYCTTILYIDIVHIVWQLISNIKLFVYFSKAINYLTLYQWFALKILRIESLYEAWYDKTRALISNNKQKVIFITTFLVGTCNSTKMHWKIVIYKEYLQYLKQPYRLIP